MSANFSATSGSLPKGQLDGVNVFIAFSGPSPAPGTVTVQMSAPYHGGRFTAQPAFNGNGKLLLDVPFGATFAAFTVFPEDDASWEGDESASFTIIVADGGIVKGEELSYQLRLPGEAITSGPPKSYESIGGGWGFKRTYLYDGLGRVAKVNWENETPFLSQGAITEGIAIR